MASITLVGTLLDPSSKVAIGDEVRFTHRTTTGSTVQSAQSSLIIGVSGAYSIQLQYGLILVEYKDKNTQQFKNLGVVTVNQDSTATTLPELLNAVVPPTDAQLLEFQAILADCVTAQLAAETAASISEAFANQLTTTELIASASFYAADVVLLTSGFTVSGAGSGSWKQTGITAQTPSQSPAQLGDALLNDGNGKQCALISNGKINLKSLGAVGDGVNDDTLAIQAWWNAVLSALELSEKQTDAPTAYAPSGNYLSSTGLILDANKYQVQIEGDGWGSAFNKVDFIFNQPFCEIRNAALYGATSTGIEVNAYDCLIFNVYIREKTTYGAWFRDAAQSFIQNSFIHRCAIGLYYAGNPQGHSLSNSKVKACTDGGILFENGGELKLTNNFIMGNANYGIKIANNAAAPDPGALQPIPIESYFDNNTITQNGGSQVYNIAGVASYDSGNKIQVTLTGDHEFPVGFGNIQIDGTGDPSYDLIKSYAFEVLSATVVVLDVPFSSVSISGTLTCEGYDLIMQSDSPTNSRNFHFVGGNINNTLINGCYNLQFWGTRLKRRVWMKGSNNSQISFFRVSPTGEYAGSTSTPSSSSERVKPIPISGPTSNAGWVEFSATQEGKAGWGSGGEALVMRTPALGTPLLPSQQPELLSEVMVGGSGVSVLNELNVTKKFGGTLAKFLAGNNTRILMGTDGSDNAQIFGYNSSNILTMFLSSDSGGNSQIPSNVNFGGSISTGNTPGVSGSFTSNDGKTITVTNGLITAIV